MKLKKILIATASVVSAAFIIKNAPSPDAEETIKRYEEGLLTTSETQNSPVVTTDIFSQSYLKTETSSCQSTSGEYIYRGIPYDMNNVPLMYNVGNTRLIVEEYNECLSNTLSSKSGLKVDEVFGYITRSENPTRHKNVTGALTGLGVKYTLNADLCSEVYDYLKTHNMLGSLTVLDESGQVRCLASYPSFDSNNYESSELENHACYNRCVEKARPGSTFKMLSGILAKKNNFLTFMDPGYIGGEFNVSNWDTVNTPYLNPVLRDIPDAIAISSNCFFAQLFYELGSEKVNSELNEVFGYNEPVVCDFVTLDNNIITDGTTNLVRSGFGIRNGVSPLYLCMISQAVINGGEMIRPYMLEESVDSIYPDKVVEHYGKRDVIRRIPNEYLEEVKEGMKAVSENLDLYTSNGYMTYAKTGTADLGEGVKDSHYICCAVDKGDGNVLSVTFQLFNSEYKYASNDAENFQDLLNIIDKNLLT